MTVLAMHELRNGKMMMGVRTIVVAVVLGVAGMALAQTQPASLPAGHPAVGAAPAASMPAGHPAIEGAVPAAMPPGHPPIGDMVPPKEAGTMPATPHAGAGATSATQGATGSLEVHLIQGTPGGPAIERGKVQLTWLHPTMSFKPREAETNENGVATFAGLAVSMVAELEGRLTFAHGGALQSLDGIHVTLESPNPKVDFKIYETTTEKPQCVVTQRHLDVLEWNQDGAHIQDNYTVRSTGDKVWLGVGEGDARDTLTLAVPPEVEQLRSNIVGGATRFERGRLTGMLVYPGERTYELEYTLPVKEGRLRVTLGAPMPIERVLVHVPADGSEVKATGLTFQPASPEETDNHVREYVASALPAGSAAVIVLGRTETAAANSALSAKNVVIGGAFVIALVGAVLMLVRKPKAKVTSDKTAK